MNGKTVLIELKGAGHSGIAIYIVEVKGVSDNMILGSRYRCVVGGINAERWHDGGGFSFSDLISLKVLD